MTMAQFGPQAMVSSGIQVPAIFRRIFDAYHFPQPQELVAPNAEEMQEQARQAQVASENPFYAEQAKAHGAIAAIREKGDQDVLQQLIQQAQQVHAPQPNAQMTGAPDQQ